MPSTNLPVQQISGQRWRQNINHLLDAVDKVAGYSDVKEILQTTAITMVYLLHAETAIVSAWDPDTETIVPEAFHTAGSWRPPSAWLRPKSPSGHPLFQRVRSAARSAQSNLGGMSLPLNVLRMMEENGIQAWLALPLIGADQAVLGIIDVLDSRAPRKFRDDEIAQGELLAKLTSVSYQRSILAASDSARVGQLAAMTELVLHLSDLPEKTAPDAVLDTLVRTVAESVGANFSLLSLFNEETGCIETVHSYNQTERAIPETFLAARPLEHYPHLGRAVRENRIVRFRLTDSNLTSHEREALQTARASTQWLIPMEARGEVLGVAEAVAPVDRDFLGSQGDRILRVLASQALRAFLVANSPDLLRQSVHFSNALVDATQLLNRSLNMSEVLVQIIEQAMAVLDCSTANLMLIEDGSAYVVEHRGYEGRPDALALLNRNTLPISTPALDRMIRTREPVVIPDTEKTDWWVVIPENDWIRSFAGAPLLADGEVIGFLNLDGEIADTFDPSVCRQLGAFASIAASVLQNARRFKHVQDRASELEIVRQATLSLTASLDLEELLQTILQRSLDLFTGPRDAHIFLYQGGKLNFGAAMDGDGSLEEMWAEPREDGLTYTVARSGLPIIVDDMRQHPLYRNAPEDWTGSIIGLPLKYGEIVVGVMNIAHQIPYGFKEHQVRMLNLLADQAAISIVNARLHHLVQEQSMTDMLTGLHNRRAFNARLDDEVQRADRYSRPFSLALMDLNGFKEVNDSFGHPAGDQVLMRISRCLADKVRNTDFLARYGGDEFALIMPETSPAVADQISLRLQKALEECDFGLSARLPVPVTVSIGIATFPEDARTAKDLIAAADAALYRDKGVQERSGG